MNKEILSIYFCIGKEVNAMTTYAQWVTNVEGIAAQVEEAANANQAASHFDYDDRISAGGAGAVPLTVRIEAQPGHAATLTTLPPT